MRVSSKVRYAVMAMCELAVRSGAFVSVADLAARHHIPQPFLEQLLLRLKRANLTVSRRGPDGGYALAVAPGQIRVGDIYIAVDGPLRLRDDENGNGGRVAQTGRYLWSELEGKVLEFLNSVTLDDLADRAYQRVPGIEVSHPYTFSI